MQFQSGDESKQYTPYDIVVGTDRVLFEMNMRLNTLRDSYEKTMKGKKISLPDGTTGTVASVSDGMIHIQCGESKSVKSVKLTQTRFNQMIGHKETTR